MRWFGWANVWLAVALTLVRGVPVLFDAMPYMRHGGKTPRWPSRRWRQYPVAPAPAKDDQSVAVVPITAMGEREDPATPI